MVFTGAFSGKNLITKNVTLFNYTAKIGTNTGSPLRVGLPIIVIFGIFFLITELILFK